MASGILLTLFANATELYANMALWICIACVLLAIAFFYTSRRAKRLAGLLILVAQFFVGYLLGYYAQAPNHQSFFWKHSKFKESQFVKVRLLEPLGEKNGSWRALARVKCFRTRSGHTFSCTGKILIYWTKKRNIDKPNLQTGDQLLLSSRVMEMPGAAFPNGFDYKAVMRYRNIQHQIFLDKSSYLKLKKDKLSLKDLAKTCQAGLIAYLDKSFPNQVSGLAKSIFLGNKEGLQAEDREAFAKSGTMHVLAVSGLHVGMVYLILNFVLSMGGRLSHLRKFRIVIILLVLWSYAFITGLGASVIRASLMFSLIELGQIFLSTRGHIFNSVFAAAYIQLILFPLNIIEVGFQLSYLAVLGILYFQPKLVGQLSFSNYIIHKTWELLCVSISATLGTLPVTLYFFHTFPVWFMLSNILLVPMAMCCLLLVLLCFIFFFLPYINQFLILITAYALKGLLKLAHFFSELPHAQIRNIYISEWESFLLLLFVPVLGYALFKKNGKTIFFLSLMLLVYFVAWRVVEHKREKQFMVVASELRNQFIITVVHGNSMTNISRPMRRTLSDSLFEFQKAFIHNKSIKKVKWRYLGKDMIKGDKWKCIPMEQGKATLFSDRLKKPIVFYWKSNKKSSKASNYVHVMPFRYFRFSDTSVHYKFVKNNYLVFTPKK